MMHMLLARQAAARASGDERKGRVVALKQKETG